MSLTALDLRRIPPSGADTPGWEPLHNSNSNKINRQEENTK